MTDTSSSSSNSLDLYQALMGADPAARDEALQQVGDWLYRLARLRFAGMAEDCAQEALVQIWRKRARVRTPAAFLGWCAAILNGVIVDTMRRQGGARQDIDPAAPPDRRRKRIPRRLQTSLEGLADETGESGLADENQLPVEGQVAGRLLSEAVIRRLVEALADNKLSANSRAIITGGFLQQQSDPELAAALGLTRNNVQVTRHRNLTKLRRDRALLDDLARWNV